VGVRPTRSGTPRDDWNVWLAGTLLVVLTLLAYMPALWCGFIWDDDAYVLENPLLPDIDGLLPIWTEPTATPQYYPLVHTTYWLEYRLWGLRPAGYHGTNILLHGLSAVLLWHLLRRLDVPAAWLAAALFALHPVQVESVAWITERKNTLSAFFYFGCALMYAPLITQQVSKPMNRWRYVLCLVLFLAALLSKTVASSFPAAVLVMVWWKHGRIKVLDVQRVLPMFFVAVPLAMLTAWLERHHVGAAGADWDYNWLERFLIAGRAIWFYASTLLVPQNLTFIYPRWTIDTSQWWQYLFPMAALLVIAILWRRRHEVGRGPLAAVLFFAGTLFPALGFVNVYPMKYSFVADHFQYIASVGILSLMAATICLAAKKLGDDRWRTVLPAMVLLTVATLTFCRCFAYLNLETLWLDTLRKNPDSEMVHTNLGQLYLEQGRMDEARNHAERAVELVPDRAGPRNNYGQVLERLGRPQEAIEQFRMAVGVEPNNAIFRGNLGGILTDHGDSQEALAELREAIRLDPLSAKYHHDLGYLLQRLGRSEEARASFARAQQLLGGLKE
jgi:tetratricopeptide (TPR) repeat protein